MKKRVSALSICLALLLAGCSGRSGCASRANPEDGELQTQGQIAELGDDSTSFGKSLEELGAYDGYFEGECTDITVTCLSGTPNAYTLEGTTLRFGAVTEKTVYAVSGRLRGEGNFACSRLYSININLTINSKNTNPNHLPYIPFH